MRHKRNLPADAEGCENVSSPSTKKRKLLAQPAEAESKKARSDQPVKFDDNASDSDSDYSDDDASSSSCCDDKSEVATTSAATPLTPRSPVPARSPRPAREKRFHCPYANCTKAYVRPCRLDEHIRSHTDTRPFLCTADPATCTKAFRRESHLARHVKSAHANERDYHCAWAGCGKKFSTGTRLRRHVATHEGKVQFTCSGYEGCSEVFRKHETLRRHVVSVHLGRKPFPCEHVDERTGVKCSQVYETAGKLKSHQTRAHAGLRYWCQACGASTAPDDAAAAAEEEQEMPAEPVGFATYGELQAHMKTAHPPTCEHCGATCSTPHELKQHREIAHGVGLEARRLFPCDHPGCHGVHSHGFTRRGNLQQHKKLVHGAAKPFVCGVTDLSASKKVEVEGVAWDGSGACGRAFGTKGSLEEHVRTQHLGLEGAKKARKRELRTEVGGADGPVELTMGTRRRKTKEVSALTRLTGVDYAETSGRDIACLVAGCGRRLVRDYDLSVHLKTAHGMGEAEVAEKMAERDALAGGRFWIGGDAGEEEEEDDEEANMLLDLQRGIDAGLESVNVHGASMGAAAAVRKGKVGLPIDPALLR